MSESLLKYNEILLKEKYSTDNRKSYYLKLKNESNVNINNRLIIFYYILILPFAYFIFYSSFSFKMKIFIILFSLLYPFIIYPLQNSMYYVLYYIYAMIYGIPIS